MPTFFHHRDTRSGTPSRSAYTAGCRCLECKQENTIAMQFYRRQKAEESWNKT